ncbi:hypothetical protein LCGC14_2478170 [marine sediment metagenome]|uniref:Uncharacterized protein n=1 Tax=marine sediment metagenome TaxID=412755 RepID=A0A0F9B937_9ZZZZ
MSGDYDCGLDESCLDQDGEVRAGRHGHHADLELQLAEAQGKLEAVDEWQEDWDGVGTIDWTALSRILKEEK